MKFKFGVVLLLCCLTGCDLFGNSPTSVVRNFQKLSEKEQNIEAMEKLYSERAKNELGAEWVLADVVEAVDFGTKVAAAGESLPFLKPTETINGEYATVTFYMQPAFAEKNDTNNQAKVLLVKENGEWKIYAFGQKDQPNPNPVANSFSAFGLSRSYLSHEELMNKRLVGKTVVIKGYFHDTGVPEDDGTISEIRLTNSLAGSSDATGYFQCKFPAGTRQPYDVAEKMKRQEVTIKGTITAKDKFLPVVVLENCAVQ